MVKSRDIKNQTFPVGRVSRAKTFQIEWVNRFRDKKCVNSFCDINVDKLHLLTCHVYHGTHVDTVQKFSRLSGNCSFCWKFSRLRVNFPDSLETFQTLWKLSRLAGNFADWLETFQTVWNFPDCLEFSRFSVNFQDSQETFQTLWKISDSLETFKTAQKLSYFSLWICYETQLTNTKIKMSETSRLSREIN